MVDEDDREEHEGLSHLHTMREPIRPKHHDMHIEENQLDDHEEHEIHEEHKEQHVSYMDFNDTNKHPFD